jgi:4-hydroxy-3-methylbut-2-enyl diphosphate reductase
LTAASNRVRAAGNERETCLLIAAPRGFCAGVDRAIEIVERALERYGAPVYVRHEIVHNRFVVDGLKAKGAVSSWKNWMKCPMACR